MAGGATPAPPMPPSPFALATWADKLRTAGYRVVWEWALLEPDAREKPLPPPLLPLPHRYA